MSSRHNVRVLRPLDRAALVAELLLIEGDAAAAERVAAKARHRLVRAEGLDAHTALLLKQELLALGADALISPAVYLGDRDAATDALIFASDRQLADLTRRLGALPLPALQQLTGEIGDALGAHDARRAALALAGGHSLPVGERLLVIAPIRVEPITPPDSVVARAGALLAAGADAVELAFEAGAAPEDALAAVAATASVAPALVRDDAALALRAGAAALLWSDAGAPGAALAQLRRRAAAARGCGAGRLVVGLRGRGGAPPEWLGELRSLGLPVAADLTALVDDAEVGAAAALAARAGADAVLAARPGAAARAARLAGALR